MLIIYRAANLVDAYLIRQVLENEGISAFIQGEYLQGAVGELPANTEILISVADADADAARTVIGEWERAEPVVDVEENPDDTGSRDAPEVVMTQRSMSVFPIIMMFLCGILIGACSMWVFYNRPAEAHEIDYDRDGRVDERVFMLGDRIDRIEYDRNRNKITDQRFHYDARGLLDKIESDDDFDGRFERVDIFRKNQIAETTIDFDHDGKRDAYYEFMRGVIYQEIWFDLGGNVVKRVQFADGVPKTGEFDGDADGHLDTARRYDRRGEIVESMPLPLK